MKKDPETCTVQWKHGEFTIALSGAMCAPVSFQLGDGRLVQPFAIAPWEHDDSQEFQELPQLLKSLRGEWVCVPFGMPETRTDLPAAWAPTTQYKSDIGDWFHGPGANAPWNVIDRFDGGIELDLVYPETHPIERLVRKVSGSDIGPRLEFELEVHPRQDCFLPIGFHPVFKLPEKPGAAILSVEGATAVHTYPVDAEIGVSKLPNGAIFESLEAARWADGSPVDLTRHPLNIQTEEIVLVAGANGRATLDNHAENFSATVTWDPNAFASCNLWISNGGRTAYPWNSRFQALGIEPVSAPFDLGSAVADSGAAPLKASGVKCGVHFKAGEKWSTKYAIEVEAR